jgi:hypothetical protein
MAPPAQNPPLHAAGYAPALALRTGRAQAQRWTRRIWGIRVYCILQNTCAPKKPLDGPLAQFGQAPRFLGKVSTGHVPAMGVTVPAAVMLIGVLNNVVPEQVFV